MELIVDVNIAVYNHASFLRQTLNSVLCQKTDFEFRLIIGDDCSTDGSTEILKEYEKKYHSKIKVIYQHTNLGLNSADRNGLIILKNSTAKYVTLLDGDDYWADPWKLQKQVDFLETHEDYSMCFSNIYEINQSGKLKVSPFYAFKTEETFTIEDLAKGNFISTPSVLFRNGLLKIPDWFTKVLVADYVMYLLIAQFGKIKYFPEPMAVYRIHNSSIWGGKTHKYQCENLIIALSYLIDYFESSAEVVDNLKYQYAHCKSQLAEIVLRDEDTDGYLKHMKEAFEISLAYMDEWLVKANRDNARLISSPEYKIGWALKHPWFMIKKLISHRAK